MNEGSPDRQGSQGAALDSPSPFKFPNKSAAEEQGVVKLRSQGRRVAVKAEGTPSTDRTLSAKTPMHTASPVLTAQRSPRNLKPDLHASPSAILSEMPALPLPADSRPKVVLKKLDPSSVRAQVDQASDTDSDGPDIICDIFAPPAKASSTITPRRVSSGSATASSLSSKKPKRFKRRLEDSLFTVPEADLSTLASMASPLHQRIVFVNPPSVLFDDADGTSAYDRDSIESWSAPPPAPFIPQFPQSKNTTQSWMHACLDAVDAMMRMPGGRDFSTPVDATALGLHDYFQVVTHPMDLGTVRSKLASKAYTVADEFVHDVRRTFSNCVLYNSLDSPIGAKAAKIWSMFCTRWFPVIDGFTPGLVVPWDEDGSFNTAFDSQTWDEQPPPIVMRELYWTCLLGNDGQCIGPDELEHHENHVLYGYLKKEDEKAVAPAPIALKNCREVRFEGYDWLYEYHPTCPGRRAILRFWIQATDFVWYRLSTPAPSYFPTYWLAVRRSLIVSRASICLSSFPSAGLDDLVAMMQGRYTPPNVKSNAKGNQAAAMLKVATDWKALTPYLASIAVFPAPSTDEIVAMYERFTDSLATCFNVNSKFNASSNAACSAIERKYKQLLKKLSEVDAFPPPDVVDLAVDVLAEPDDRTKTPGSGGRGRPKVPKEESNEGEVKEKKKRGRKKGSALHKDSDKSKKSDGDASEPKRRRSEDSTEGATKKRRRRRSSSEVKEEKSKSGVEGEKRKRDRKAEKERRDALKLAEFGGSLAEVKLTDEQRRERDALAYKPKIPVEKLSEETRARHEELAQALRQQFVSASRADNETRRQVANVISSIIATIERRDETEKRSEERRKKTRGA